MTLIREIIMYIGIAAGLSRIPFDTHDVLLAISRILLLIALAALVCEHVQPLPKP